MSKRERPTQPPWSVPIRYEDVPEAGTRRTLVADETTRAAVAALAGLRGLSRFEATFDITRQGRGLHVFGEVSATVGQTCVVTLEPIENQLREPVDIAFLPASDAVPEAGLEEGQENMASEADDGPEPLIDGTADLGALAVEFLLLGVDPYPRKPEAVFDAPVVHEARESPFAALAALKREKEAKK